MPLRVRKLNKASPEPDSSSSAESDQDGYLRTKDSTAAPSRQSVKVFKAPLMPMQVEETAQDSDDDVVFWGYVLLSISWLVFVGGVGGLLGIWDSILGLQHGEAAELVCFLCLMSVTGFAWVLLNWLGLKSFRMTSSKA